MVSSWNIPEGIVCKTCFFPLKTSVCPALGPPWNLAMILYLEVRTSTILPFPSSPHCIQVVNLLPFLVIVLFYDFRKSIVNDCEF